MIAEQAGKSVYRNRYIIQKKLGAGGQGDVYLITDKQDNDKLKALKIIPILGPYNYSRITTEPKLVTTLNHPNIIKAENYYFQKYYDRYDKSHCTQQLYIVLEYAQGGALSQFLGKLSIDDIKSIYNQVRSGLEYLHSHKIIHRDIGLRNILLDKQKNAKIIDFGLSSEVDQEDTSITVVGNGTANYKPPELYAKQKIKTPKGDLWSFGVVMLQLCLGKPIHQVLKGVPGEDSQFPEIILKKSKIPKIFVPVIRCLCMKEHTKREFKNLEEDWSSEQNKVESVIEQDKEILCQDYIVYSKDIIGKGSSGEIYHGYSKKKNCYIAIKKLHSSLKKKSIEIQQDSETSMIEQNAEQNAIEDTLMPLVMKIFNHKNILRIIDLVNVQSITYVISEFCERGDLERSLKSKVKLTQKESFEVLYELVGALHQMHKKNYVHRNITPAHILIKQDGSIKLTGFGKMIDISKFGDTKGQLNQISEFADKLNYTAPEILRFKKHTGKCDTWSVGCILYEILTGKPAFNNEYEIEKLKKQQNLYQMQPKYLQGDFHILFHTIIPNLINFKEEQRTDIIDLYKYLLKNKETTFREIQNRTQIDSILNYIDFLMVRGKLFLKCAQELSSSKYYPIKDFSKFTLMYILRGRYIQVMDLVMIILRQSILTLPNKQVINTKLFDADSAQYYLFKRTRLMNEILNDKLYELSVIKDISEHLLDKKILIKEGRIYNEYKYLYEILADTVKENNLREENYEYFIYNYKLFLLKECRPKQIRKIEQPEIRIYNFCLKLINLYNNLREQNFEVPHSIDRFLDEITKSDIETIICNIERIHNNLEGQY